MKLAYWVVDAFTDTQFSGNPAAVVLPDVPLADAVMQAIAAENNLSETAFAVPEGDGYRLRWFTPTVEVDLCGHATLASAFVLARQGVAGPFRFHTRSGVLTAAMTDGGIELDFPAHGFAAAEMSDVVVRAVGMAPVEVFQAASLVAVLPSAGDVVGLRPDLAAIRTLPGGILIVTAAGGADSDVTSRFFGPGVGIDEDPVTGSMHTQIVPYWAAKLGKRRLICHQASQRGGRMVATLDGDRVRLEGQAVLFAEGTIFLA